MDFAKRRRFVVDFIFILVLFAVFMIAALFVVLFGTKIYSGTTRDMDRNYSKRTAYYYINNKLQNYNEKDAVYVTDYDGNALIELTSNIEGTDYITYLYIADGYLKEITAPADLDFDYSNGADILPATGLEVSYVTDSLMNIVVTDKDGQQVSFYHNIVGEASRHE